MGSEEGRVEVEVVGAGSGAGALREAAAAAVHATGVAGGHLAVALAGEEEIRRLNREHRGRDEPTDVLSFPVDAAGPAAGPRELGDVVVCPARADGVVEAVVHGVLHLCGLDHEADGGEMLALQGRVMAELRSGGGGGDGGGERTEGRP